MIVRQGPFEVVVAKQASELFAFAYEDCVISNSKVLIQARGSFLCGQPAATFTSESSMWVAFEMNTDEVMVVGSCNPELGVKLAPDVIPLHNFINFLEQQGKVCMDIVQHTYDAKSDDETKSRYNVESKQDAILKVTAPKQKN